MTETIVNKQRPVNLDLLSMRFPITAISSILHRITGVLLFLGVPFLLWLLSLSLKSNEGFNQAYAVIFDSFLGSFLFWAVLSSLAYHVVAGIRHLLMDMGIGETLAGGILGSQIILFLGVCLSIVLGVWIW